MQKGMEGTNRNLSEVCDDSLAVEDHYVAVPQLIRPLSHARVGSVLLFKVHWFKDLERTPSMIHEDFDIQVSPIIAVHGESARLRQRVNDGRMSVEVAASLHTTEAKTTRGLQRVAVQHDFIYGPVVVVKSRQRSDCAIHHRAVETGRGSHSDSISEGLHLLLHVCRVFLERLQKASVLEAHNASRVLL
jgi:hypothetical protein